MAPSQFRLVKYFDYYCSTYSRCFGKEKHMILANHLILIGPIKDQSDENNRDSGNVRLCECKRWV